MYNGMTVGAIIVAAGQSRRMGGVNKMWADLAGKPVIARSLAVFLQSPLVDSVVIVMGKNDIEMGDRLVRDVNTDKSLQICTGGERRQDSVAAGLGRLGKCSWVIIHDGARPLITPDLIEKGLKAAHDTGAATAAVPVKDTIKSVDENMVVAKTLSRQQLWAIQTPQVFRFDIITRAYGQVKSEVTDDAAMVEQIGYKVKVFDGSYDNIKITTPDDLIVAGCLIDRGRDKNNSKFKTIT